LAVIALTFSPIDAPQNFQFAEQIINESGWVGLKSYFVADDLLWAVIHLSGVCLLLFTFWQLTMSLLHIVASGSKISNGLNDSWIVRKTAKYCTPWTNILFFSIFLFLAGTMVSGVLLHWIQVEIPAFFINLFNIIMYGKG
jgi:hypothetical protein